MAPEPDQTAIRVALWRALHGELDSFFESAEILELARGAGFREVRQVSADSLAERYFSGRADGLRPPSGGEELLVATT